MRGPICMLVIQTMLHYFYVMVEEGIHCSAANAEKELGIIL